MDEETTENVKTNLNEMKDYADKFPQNAGMRWISESIDKTLLLIDPEEEPKNDDKFDMPKATEAQASDDAQSASDTNVESEPIVEPTSETPDEEE